MSANEPYRLFVTSRTSGQFNYNAQLLGPDGQQVSTTWTDTVWGAKRWAKTEPPTVRPHCEGHGGPGRWYCCQHPDAGWPCTETVEDES